RAPRVRVHRVGHVVGRDVAEVEQQRERIGARRAVGDRLARFDHERRPLLAHASADGLEPRRADAGVRHRRVHERAGGGHREKQGEAPRSSHSLASSSDRSNLRISRCFTSESGSLTSWMTMSPCGVMVLMAPSRSLSPWCTRYVLLSGPWIIAISAPRLCMTPRTEISLTVIPDGPSPLRDDDR